MASLEEAGGLSPERAAELERAAIKRFALSDPREDECPMTKDGNHRDGDVDPDRNERVCSACHESCE